MKYFLFLLVAACMLLTSCGESTEPDYRAHAMAEYLHAEECVIIFKDTTAAGADEKTIQLRAIHPGEDFLSLPGWRTTSMAAMRFFTDMTHEEKQDYKWVEINFSEVNGNDALGYTENHISGFSVIQLVLADSFYHICDSILKSNSFLLAKGRFDMSFFAEPQLQLFDSARAQELNSSGLVASVFAGGFQVDFLPDGRQAILVSVVETRGNFTYDHQATFILESGKIAGWKMHKKEY